MCSSQLTQLQRSLLCQKEQVAVSNSIAHPKPGMQLHMHSPQGPRQLETTLK